MRFVFKLCRPPRLILLHYFFNRFVSIVLLPRFAGHVPFLLTFTEKVDWQAERLGDIHSQLEVYFGDRAALDTPIRPRYDMTKAACRFAIYRQVNILLYSAPIWRLHKIRDSPVGY